MRSRCRSLPFLLAIFSLHAGCEDSPLQPDITRLAIGTVTAEFHGLEVELLKYNLSWFPRDESPRPEETEVFTTFHIRVRNGSTESRALRRTDFRYRTLVFPVGNGPVWDSFDGGRTPRLEEGTLGPQEEVRGWLTYRVSKGEYADELLWWPQQDVAFAIYLPPDGSASRFQHSLVFGRVTDAEGRPVEGAQVLVTPVDPDVSGNISEVGNCAGGPRSIQEVHTDLSGWYRASLESHLSDRLCIDVQVMAPPGSGLADARAGGGIVVPGQETAFAQAPEIRIDVTLPIVSPTRSLAR